MAKEKLFIANPTNHKDISLVASFSKRNDIAVEPLNNERTVVSNSNEIYENLYLIRDEKIIDSCYLEGKKDTRSCNLSFPILKEKMTTRKIVGLSVDYAFNNLDMEEVFVIPNKDDKGLINILEKNDFESLGVEGSTHPFIKERMLEKERSRSI